MHGRPDCEPDGNGGRINMGAYGNTGEASKSPAPIALDAGGNHGVSILDLIYIRNKLNMDVTIGDNWRADVNSDGKINALDLIFVRNLLNTSR